MAFRTPAATLVYLKRMISWNKIDSVHGKNQSVLIVIPMHVPGRHNVHTCGLRLQLTRSGHGCNFHAAQDTKKILSLQAQIRCISRSFMNSARMNSPQFNPKQESRRKTLLLFTYISGFIGACLLTAIGFRHYASMANRAIGIEELRIREYGRRPQLLRYRGYILSSFITNDVKGIHQFDVREDDIWVVSFPKAGTTWLQEIVYLISSDVDVEKAAETQIDERFPYFEWIYPGKKTIAAMPSPRLIKSHLPLSLLPNQVKEKKPKIIYIARNPKDTMVSYHYFIKKFLKEVDHVFHGDFEDYCRLFVEDIVLYGPWWKHVKEAWDRKDEDNLLVLFYEDLKMDLHKAVQDIAAFLNKPLTNSQIETIVQLCSFESMKKNIAVNYDWLKDAGLAHEQSSFLRKGKVGDWKTHLSADIVKKMDEIVATKLAGVPIKDTIPEK